MRSRIARLVIAACLLASTPAFADEAPETEPAPAARSSIEVAFTTGPSVVFGEPALPSTSLRRVGVFGELAIAFRSKYFIAPFLSAGYGTLASGTTEVPSSPSVAGGTLDQHLGVWLFSPGITADIWRVRPRYGLGLAAVTQSFGFQGQERSSTQYPLAHQLGLGFLLLDIGRFRLDAETRLVIIGGADVTFMTIDLVARGDLIRFGTGAK